MSDTSGQPSADLAADIAYGGGRSENIRVPATPVESPLGTAIEEAIRATTTVSHGYSIGPHEAAFVAAVTAREWIANRLRDQPWENSLPIADAIEKDEWDV